MIIIVNDNDQSIAENHGGLYRGLRELRESNGESSNNIFKSLGLDYRFVADGNDLETGKLKKEHHGPTYAGTIANYLMGQIKADPTVVAIAAGTPGGFGFNAKWRFFRTNCG